MFDRTFALLLFLTLAPACAHNQKADGLEALKPAIETFHQRIRWKDYRGAAEMIVDERRAAFHLARAAQHDDRDLSFTDYQLEDAKLSDDGLSATVVSRLSWMRLPSVTEKEALVTSHWVYRSNSWWIESQDAGPFLPELAPLPSRRSK